MKRLFLIIVIVAGVAIISASHYSEKQAKQNASGLLVPLPEEKKPVPDSPAAVNPKIQIVFALDATGSMAGLIGAAKEKIWSIAGSLAQAEPSPDIEMGLLFYRDKGDEFVTRKIPMSKDFDSVYAELMKVVADGGGDSPESVNQALFESVSHFKWDTAGSTYRTVFLVGDCPPHMNYRDDVKYPVSCKNALNKDIVLNTILMGNDAVAKRIWKEIATCSQGNFSQVNMDANDFEINTPFDSIIAFISDGLDDTRVYYGNDEERSASEIKKSKSRDISYSAKASVKARRAEYNFTKSGKTTYYGRKELIEDFKNKNITLENIKAEELPDEMKNLSDAEKKVFIDKKIAKRDSLQKELTHYSKLRQEYIVKDLKTKGSGKVDSSFSNQIFKSIQKQTEKKKIRLNGEAKY
ncbi:vWA domain-containing protein [Pollutibacter soli]|uniref:vWA domain-containing protein n=1 Tax=Pollutibacter soli TaxID=3034157 RepID=UPI003013FAEE